LNSDDFLDKFQWIFKLMIETLSQRISMTSYDRPAPKILSAGRPGVIYSDVSYLDKICTLEDYDTFETSMRVTIKSELKGFSTSHKQ